MSIDRPNGNPSQSYGASPVAFPSHTCHLTQVNAPVLNPTQTVLDLPTPEGWKAEFIYLLYGLYTREVVHNSEESQVWTLVLVICRNGVSGDSHPAT